MMFKNTIIALITITCFSLSAETMPKNVESIKENSSGNLKVKCEDKSKGTISFEESNICTFSKKRAKKRCEEIFGSNEENNDCIFSQNNLKNRCESDIDWSVEDAAEFLCQE